MTVNSDVTYTATFAINTHTLTVKTAKNNTTEGTVKINSGTAGATATANINHGSSANITATPATGYNFSKWNDNSASASRSVTVNADVTYTASFTIKSYKITVNSNNTNYGTVSGGGTYNHGATATLTATPKGCYRFKQWSDGNTNATRTVTVTAAKTYTATFEETTFTGNCGPTGNEAKVKYSLNACTGVMTISGSGAMKDYGWGNCTQLSYDYTPWYSHNDEIKSVVISNGVTTIGACTFLNCSYITSVTIAGSVTRICDGAFDKCKNLKSVNIPNSVTFIGNHAFYDCGLTSLTIPNSVKTIECDAFCFNSFASITLPNSVTTIGKKAFGYCYSLKDITVAWTTANAIPTWDEMTTNSGITLHVPCGTSSYYGAKSGWNSYSIVGGTKYTIKANVSNTSQGKVQINTETVGTSVNSVFYCDEEARITAIPTGCYRFKQWSDGVKDNPRTVVVSSTTAAKTYTAQFEEVAYSGNCGTTGNESSVKWALNTCSGILSITGTGVMMDWTSNAGVPWYNYRSSIQTVTIANGVTNIGSKAFINCSNLTSVSIPPSVTKIGVDAFYGCAAIESVYITDLAAWCTITYSGSTSCPFKRNDNTSSSNWGGKLYLNNTPITNLTIPNDVTAISAYAFFGCIGITSINFNQATSIDQYAFAACHGLTSVTIPNTVTAIYNNAFAYCTKLQTVSLPGTLTTIRDAIFYNCLAMTDITVGWTENVPAWTAYFTSKQPQSSITLHVPKCSQLLYRAMTGWKDYTIAGETENHSVAVNTNNADYGLVQIDNETPAATATKTVDCISSVILTAKPADGYHFVEWSDGNLNPVRSWATVDADIQLTAYFALGTPEETWSPLTDGALSGEFSISATEKVHFSKGQLQYNPTLDTHLCADGTTKPGTWRFSDHQYDFVGNSSLGNVYYNNVKCNINNASATYPGWMDMFCWGASGYKGIQPWAPNRPSTTTLYGDNAYYDWGVYNAISNGGNKPGMWRTLKNAEWNYMLKTRTNATNLNVPANVADVNGLILLPDNWVMPSGINLVMNASNYYTANVFTATEWEQLEAAGAVFIPATGWFTWNNSRWVASTSHGTGGEVWASDGSSVSSQYDVQWTGSSKAYTSASSTNVLELPRLVAAKGSILVQFVGYNDDGEKYIIAKRHIYYGETPVAPDVPARECYTFTGWDKTVVPATENTVYTAQYELPHGICGANGDNLTWELSCDSVLTITGTGAMADYSYSNPVPWKAYTGKIKEVVISNGITYIGVIAFAGCYNLKSVNIGADVTSIGNEAFVECTALSDIIIPDNVQTIGNSAYWKCSNAKTLVIGSGVTSIGDAAFSECKSVTSIIIPDNVLTIGPHAFNWCDGATTLSIGTGVTIISNYAFNACGNITNVTIPDNVEAIHYGAFSDCLRLETVTIGVGVQTIQQNVFLRCSSLTDVYVGWKTSSQIPTIQTNIHNNTSKPTLHIPCGTTAMYSVSSKKWVNKFILQDDGANTVSGIYGDDNIAWEFNYCDSTLRITGDGEMRCDDGSWVSGSSGSAFNVSAVKRVFIGKGLTYLGIYTLSLMANMEYIEVEEGNPKHRTGCNAIIRNGNGAEGDTLIFGCKNTVIPPTCTTIRGYAFSDCQIVTSMTIPTSVTQIANMTGSLWENNNGNVFYTSSNANYGLKDLYVKWTTKDAIPEVKNNKLGDMTNVKLHVPCGTKAFYKQVAGWNKFKDVNIIEEDASFTITVESADDTQGSVSIEKQ